MRTLTLGLGLLLSFFAQAQAPQLHTHDRAIHFPNLPEWETLIVDLHQHTVFSDGSVWPNIRVQEALLDSVDAISLTEHLEYQPHAADLPHPDRNRSYELASQYAKPYDLLVIHGAEITRNMPPGHSNALFIEDANKLQIEDSIEVFREVKRQGGFAFWNHPNWIAQQHNGQATMTEVHQQLVREGLLHGIEVVNDLTYSDEALQIALDYNLTILGTSDIHGVVDWQYGIAQGGHRPVTLAFCQNRSVESIKEALFARRTVVWYNNMLIGRSAWLAPLIDACLSVEKAEYQGISAVLNVHIKNDSDVEFILANRSDYNFHNAHDIITIHPNATTILEVKTEEQLELLQLEFEVLNAVTAPGKHERWVLEAAVK